MGYMARAVFLLAHGRQLVAAHSKNNSDACGIGAAPISDQQEVTLSAHPFATCSSKARSTLPLCLGKRCSIRLGSGGKWDLRRLITLTNKSASFA
mgnify:CR=1 FL=1